MEQFINALSELHKKIDEVELVESSEELTSLQTDISSILEDPGSFKFDHHPVFKDKLVDALDQFEISHPSITTALKAAVQALSAMGI